MKFAVRNRFSGEVQFTAEIECDENEILIVKLGLAVKWALKNNASLRDADLRGADLRGADLRSANLRGADLRSANLRDADLRDAYLRDADLRDADLRDADLRDADLRDAYLRGANLRGADLRSANLRDAYLRDADLRDADEARLRILPDEGDVIGWKKCNSGVIAKLLIKSNTPRSNATGRKCRCAEATVLDLFGGDVGITDKHGPRTEYRKGQVVECDNWNDDLTVECGGGIHFFITRAEAEAW